MGDLESAAMRADALFPSITGAAQVHQETWDQLPVHV